MAPPDITGLTEANWTDHRRSLSSELVTNAVLHPTPGDDQPTEFRISSYPDRVFVEVIDAGPDSTLTPSQSARKPESDGRGLRVVDRLTSRWGIRPRPDGGRFCVWYELPPVAKQSSLAGRDVGSTGTRSSLVRDRLGR